MMQTAPTTIEYRAADHGFFEELVRLAISLGSIGVGLELQKSGKAKPFGYNDTIAIVGKPDVSSLEIHFRPRPLFDRLLSPSGRQPRFLTIVKRTINPSPPEHPIFLSKIQLMMARLIGDAFVSYYERQVDAVVARWQKKEVAGLMSGVSVGQYATLVRTMARSSFKNLSIRGSTGAT